MGDYSDSGSGGEGRRVEGETALPEARLEDAIAFLRRIRPDGPWTLTAILPERDSGPTQTKTFGPDNSDDALAWLEARSGRMNLYWMVNPAMRPLSKKATKGDVLEAVAVWVDIDPKKGEDAPPPAAARAAAIAELEKAEHAPLPSIVIDSGGGVQALWLLDEPFPIDGKIPIAEDFEAYNQYLEEKLGGDNCHNCDRILRLPGTINLPNAEKRKAGRVPRLATLIEECSSWKRHPLGKFWAAVRKRDAGRAALERGALRRIASEKDLEEWNVPGWATATIAQGHNPLEPEKWGGDRSRAVFAVTCELVACDVPPELIVGILTDEGLGISGHILEQKRAVEYAWYQVERATAAVARRAENTTSDGCRILDPADPYRTGLRLCDELFPDAIHTNDDWLEWRTGAYRDVEDETVEARLWKELDSAMIRVPQKNAPPTLERFKPNRAKVGEVVAAMRGIAHQPADTMAPPVWLDGDGPPPLEIVPCKNGLLHVPTGELLAPTPRFFTRNALDLEYDPAAPSPELFLAFVEEVLPDPVARMLLQDYMGYLLLPDTSQQKILLMVGPPRAGKGVTQRIITQLVGEGNTCSPMSGDLANPGVGMMQPLIGKTVAFMSDARFGRHAHGHTITEKLLTISGGDNVTISRKHKAAWTGRLPTRFVLLSNELPGLRDNSPALANRFVPLLFEKSFLGREDPTLAERIIATEMPGILNWTLEGWQRLRHRGRFILPQASADAIGEILELGSPVAAFVREFCVLGPDKSIDKRLLFSMWKDYCKENDLQPGTSNHFARDLYAATNSAVKSKREGEDEQGIRPYVFAGIGKIGADEPPPY